MNMLLLIAVLSVAAALFIFIKAAFLRKRILMQDMFVIGLFIYSIGVVVVYLKHELLRENALEVMQYSVIALFSSMVGYLLSAYLMPITQLSTDNLRSYTSKRYQYLTGLTVIVVIVFNTLFMAMVYKVIIAGIHGGIIALLDVRKAIATGEAGYFAPGLIKQIRDILAPTLVVYLILFSTFRPYIKRILLLTLVVSSLAAMMFGGQRMPLLVLMLVMCLSFLIKRKNKNAPSFSIVVYGVLVLGLVFVVNVALGRSDEDSGLGVALIKMIWGLVERVFLAAPNENIEAWRFLQSMNMPYFSLWRSDLAILLPGSQVGISNEIHSYLGGSSAGNSVLGMPVDIYLNSKYAGLVFVPIAAQMFFSLLERLIEGLRSPFLFCMRLVLIVYLPFCYSFYLFLLNGGIFILVICALFFGIKLIRWKLNESKEAIAIVRIEND